MIEIGFSHMSDILQADAWNASLSGLLKEQPIAVRDTKLSWWSAWSDLVRMALYGAGADISEIGSTWLVDTRLIYYRRDLLQKAGVDDQKAFTSSLPARQEVLLELGLQGDPFYRAISQGFQRGRSFNLFNMWGLVEERLCKMIGSIWQELFTHPQTRAISAIDKYLLPLARQLDLVLGAQ